MSCETRDDLSENEVDQALEAFETATLSRDDGSDVTVPVPDVFRPAADFPVAESAEFRFTLSADPAALLVSRCSLMHVLSIRYRDGLPEAKASGSPTKAYLFQRLYRRNPGCGLVFLGKFISSPAIKPIKGSVHAADRKSCNSSGYPL